MTKYELLLHAKAHVKAAEKTAARLTAELLAETPRNGSYAEADGEKIVVVPVEPKLTQDEQASLLDAISRRAPGARDLFLGARFCKDTLAAARGSRNPDEAEAARLYDEAMDAKRDQRAAGGRDRTVQVTVSPERIAVHLAGIEEALALAAADSIGAADNIMPQRETRQSEARQRPRDEARQSVDQARRAAEATRPQIAADRAAAQHAVASFMDGVE